MVDNTSKWGKATAAKRYADGGVTETPVQKAVNDSLARGAVNVARARNSFSRATGYPDNKGALSVQQNADMSEAENISDAVPRNGKKGSELGWNKGGKVK